MAGAQGVGVVGSQDPQPVGEQLLGGGGRAGGVSGRPPPVGEVVAGAQGVGVVGSQDPQPVGEQLLEGGGRAGGVSGLPRQ
ncbi:MAG: hypothetical protein WKF73_07040 [Nocardioidaceae bacterium]